jgi:hypothetical protein
MTDHLRAITSRCYIITTTSNYTYKFGSALPNEKEESPSLWMNGMINRPLVRSPFLLHSPLLSDPSHPLVTVPLCVKQVATRVDQSSRTRTTGYPEKNRISPRVPPAVSDNSSRETRLSLAILFIRSKWLVADLLLKKNTEAFDMSCVTTSGFLLLCNG